MILPRHVPIVIGAFTLMLFSSGCVPVKQARVEAVARTVQDVAQAASKQSDLNIIREGTPAYLMLLDGLIEAYPMNKDLLLAGSQAYSSYASSFFSDDEHDKTEALYRKAKLYGFRALSDRADFGKVAGGELDGFTALLNRFNEQDVPGLFWTANAWAGWISAKQGDVEAMADLPMLEATMKRILELDETFYYGGPHLLMGAYLAAKPAILGGDLTKSKRHFDRAFALGSGRILMSRVLFAQYYARGVGNRDLFTATLQE
ncbi:MAG TPA: TRAP transporter TatT component family protein, partial [Nitrospirota bacterium]|nr:TRAP transporter TatT component family protein [Nitrospirota bacterium]